MSNTIGSAPRPATTARSSNAAPATAATGAAEPKPKVLSPEEQAQVMRDAWGTSKPSKTPLGPTVKSEHTPEALKAMSNDDLKKITGEEVMGMNKNQFDAYETAVTKDGGVGMKNLDPQARKAILRKNIMKSIMEDCARMAEKHNKW